MITAKDWEEWNASPWDEDYDVTCHIIPETNGEQLVLLAYLKKHGITRSAVYALDKLGRFPDWHPLYIAPDWVKRLVGAPILPVPDMDLDEIHRAQELMEANCGEEA